MGALPGSASRGILDTLRLGTRWFSYSYEHFGIESLQITTQNSALIDFPLVLQTLWYTFWALPDHVSRVIPEDAAPYNSLISQHFCGHFGIPWGCYQKRFQGYPLGAALEILSFPMVLYVFGIRQWCYQRALPGVFLTRCALEVVFGF